ncbi:MAG: hypothetical protein EOP84_26315 [Verrucomicrobiaceae bacterium]|nr:MAG: hypothetical protein EOP84_26315 [Verrucomicrobiaceae bacterium]
MVDALSDREKVVQVALTLDEEGRSIEAVNLLRPLISGRDNPRYLVAYAHCLNRAGGDWKEAIVCLQVALAIEPKYFEGGTRLFLATLLIEHGFKSEAIEQWRIVSRMAPDGTGYGAVPDEAIIMLKKHET